MCELCDKKSVGKNEESWKVLSWKVQHEIGKNEVGMIGLKLESTTEVGQ